MTASNCNHDQDGMRGEPGKGIPALRTFSLRPPRLPTAALFCLLAAPAFADDTFAARVAPIFERHCLRCHNDDEHKGGLSLTSAVKALAGGESGAVLVPAKPDESYLLDAVSGDKPSMPKGDKPLSREDVASIKAWIADGAAWPKDAILKEKLVVHNDWWSLQPLRKPDLPAVDHGQQAWARTPVDLFVAVKHAERGLSPTPEADKRTLVRRLHFDLIGLPPTPAEIDAFLSDSSPDAWEKLVDRLLGSPHYGERWARHWLDVVHFGETHGYDKDKPRPYAWPYRDYVIRAFNADTPYGRFVEEQVAGDVLYPGTVDGVEALGFIAAGPWDFIGHAEVPETKIDGMVARHLDRDDMVANTIGTFNSLTVQCAQCHNHKFDPIPQEDYYRLQAVFAAIDRADKKYFASSETAERYAALETRHRSLSDAKKRLEAAVAKAGGEALAGLDRQIAAATQPLAAQRAEYGYHSRISPKQDEVKWVQVDLGKSVAIDRIVLAGCWDDFNRIGAGFGFPVRYRIELSDDAQFTAGVTVIENRTASDVPNPGIVPQITKVDGKSARYVRITALKLAPRLNDFIFALSELVVLDSEEKNLAAGAVVTSLDSIEAPPRWRKSNLTDGWYPGLKGASAGSLAELRQQREALINNVVDPATRSELEKTSAELAGVATEIAKLPPPSLVYAGTVHHGSGAFSGTGANGGKPRTIRLLHRGNVTQPKEEVGPGALQAVTALAAQFDLPANAEEGDRRAALARWISSRDNPLTWRSIVNRVWQYHFGRGLVDTPNDFGRMGGQPSHPELLDWLAADFRDNGQSLKRLHRQIVLSATYRQGPGVAARDLASPQALDANNVYLWRMPRRKLEAESVRDAVLAVSGRLRTQMGGPSFQDFVIDQPAHSPHYEYHLHDPADVSAHRRSVYRFLVRSQPQPFMTTLDCADPSMRVDKRNESVSALQALALLNNGFMVTMSKHFAERIDAEAGDLNRKVRTAFREALAREPSDEEAAALTAYAAEHGLPNACRLLFNLNEFAFVD